MSSFTTPIPSASARRFAPAFRRLSTAFLLLAATAVPALADARFVTSDHVEIRYLDAGPKDAAKTLLLIPGWRFTADVFSHAIHTFSAKHRVVALDPRSQGASSKVQSGNSPERRAADVHELLLSLHLHDVVLVGWSQGAQDVAAYLGQFGTEGLAGIVLVDSPVSAGPAEVTLRPEFVSTVLGGIGVYAAHPAEYTAGMLQSIIRHPPAPAEMARLEAIAMATPVDTGVAMLVLDMLAVDRRPNLARADRPALVIAAADSPLLAAQRDTATALKARFETIADAGHAVFLDQPERFEAILSDFVAGLERSR